MALIGFDDNTSRESSARANVYMGARPIVEALARGANVIVTGRSTDTALTYGPLIHEFGWALDDWDRLESGLGWAEGLAIGSRLW